MPLFTPRLTADISRCVRCGACNSHCPVYSLHSHAETKSPRSWIKLSSSVNKKEISVSVEFIEFMYGCTQCALCSGVCPVGLDPSYIILKVRKELIDQGYVPPMAVAALPEEVLGGEVFPTPLETVAPMAGGRPTYLAGCWGESTPEVDVAASAALERLLGKIRLGDRACGVILRYAGYFDQEEEVLEVLVRENSDARFLVSACPEQVRAIRESHPEMDVRFIFDLLEEIPVGRIRGERYLIIPDCRSPSVGEKIGEILAAAGAEAMLAPDELCCSCGHLVTRRAQPDVIRRLAVGIVNEATAVGSSAILFVNPACYGMISEVIRSAKGIKFSGRLSEPAEELLRLLK